MKSLLRALFSSVVTVATAGCLGGQTGQPDSGECGASYSLSPTAVWSRDRTPAELAQAFQGQHTAPLTWFEEALDSPTQTPLTLDDQIAIDVRYEGGSARTVSCKDGLYVSVTVDTKSAASGLHEAGTTELRIDSATTPSTAHFVFMGEHANIGAELGEVESGASPSGTVVPTEGGAPGASARF